MTKSRKSIQDQLPEVTEDNILLVIVETVFIKAYYAHLGLLAQAHKKEKGFPSVIRRTITELAMRKRFYVNERNPRLEEQTVWYDVSQPFHLYSL